MAKTEFLRLNRRNEAMKTSTQANNEIIATAFATDEQRWAAVQARNPLADGDFVCAVKTTGVYCRSGWSARRQSAGASGRPKLPGPESRTLDSLLRAVIQYGR